MTNFHLCDGNDAVLCNTILLSSCCDQQLLPVATDHFLCALALKQ